MDDLKAKIAAIFAEDDPFVGIGKSSYDKADRVLALIATHAAEPAPVAVEGAPERVWLGPAIGPQGLATWNVEGMLAGDWDTETSGLNYPEEAVRYIRADLAPTGNTALVEALEKIAAEEFVRVGYDQTDIGTQPVLTAQEMQAVARAALASREAAAPKEGE